MTNSNKPSASGNFNRRDVNKIAAASALSGVSIPYVHAAKDNDPTRLALIGCGGRGTGAVANAITASKGSIPVKLYAMADVDNDQLYQSHASLAGQRARPEIKAACDVPKERQYIGFDGYAKAIDTLRAGDIAIFTSPCAFRWVHYKKAIEKGVNVFMEKPLTPDGPSTRRMFSLNAEAKKKNLKVGVGLMCRHCEARGELFKRIQDGAIGEINMMRAYRMQGPVASCRTKKNPGNQSELSFQIQNFHSFLWLSGGAFSDFFIHNIDECCWMKNDWPVEAQAVGGRHYRGDYIDQNFDSYSVEYTFSDGSKLFMDGRNVTGCKQEFASYAHGSKGAAVISSASHTPAHPRIYKGQKIEKIWRRPNQPGLVWKWNKPEPNPYELEWKHLLDAIRDNTPHNEVERGLKSSLVTSMGRMAAHTGQVISYDQMLNLEHEFGPDNDKLTLESKPPLAPGADGKYPVPQPGILRDREYEA